MTTDVNFKHADGTDLPGALNQQKHLISRLARSALVLLHQLIKVVTTTVRKHEFSGLPLTLKSYAKISMIAVFAIGLSACATQKPLQSNQATSYEGLVKISDNVMAVAPKKTDYGRYKWAVIDSIEVEPSVASEDSAETTKSVVGDLKSALATEVGKSFNVQDGLSNAPTLILHTRITRITEASPATNVLTTALVGTPIMNGALAVELEAIDATSGKQVALLVWADSGGVFKDFTGNYARSSHARALATRFAVDAGKFLSPLSKK